MHNAQTKRKSKTGNLVLKNVFYRPHNMYICVNVVTQCSSFEKS